MDSRFIRRMNFRRNIQGKIISSMCLVFWCLLKARRLLDAHKELIVSLLFFVLEAISVVLDQTGKNKPAILLVALLLAAFSFAITLYSIIKARPDQISMDQKQLKVVEFVFSVIQLIAAFIEYLLTVLQVKNDYNASAFPLASAVIAVVFCFIKGRRITDSSQMLPDGSSTTDIRIEIEQLTAFMTSDTTEPDQQRNQANPPRSSVVKRRTHASKQGGKITDSSTTDSPIENLQQPIGSTTSIPTELDQIGTLMNQVNPASSIVKQHEKELAYILLKEKLAEEVIGYKVKKFISPKVGLNPPKFISPKVGLNPPPKFISPKVGSNLSKRKNFKLRR